MEKSVENIVTSRVVMKKSAHGFRARERAGLAFGCDALKMCGAARFFADPFVAIGFFTDLAERGLTKRQLEAFAARGRAEFESLKATESMPAAPSEAEEVIVSIPIGTHDRFREFFALGLRKTSTSVKRGFVEFRGFCNTELLSRLTEDVGGSVSVVTRPAPITETAHKEGDVLSTQPKPTQLTIPQTPAVAPGTLNAEQRSEAKHVAAPAPSQAPPIRASAESAQPMHEPILPYSSEVSRATTHPLTRAPIQPDPDRLITVSTTPGMADIRPAAPTLPHSSSSTPGVGNDHRQLPRLPPRSPIRP